MRLDTGSSSDAVLASHTVVIAKGSGGRSSCAARERTTGVSKTAVVSSDNTMVVTDARTTTSSHNTMTRPRPSVGGDVCRDVEDTGGVSELGDDGHRSQEQQDRGDAAQDVIGLVPRQDPSDEHEQSSEPGDLPDQGAPTTTSISAHPPRVARGPSTWKPRPASSSISARRGRRLGTVLQQCTEHGALRGLVGMTDD